MTRRQRNHSRHALGFTLIEVLVTISVISIVIPVIMQGISIATGLASITRQRAEVVSLAQSKLDELVVTGEWQTGSLSGDFGPDHPNYQWQATVTDWEEEYIEQLQISVTWASRRGTQREMVLSTLIYVPTEEATQ